MFRPHEGAQKVKTPLAEDHTSGVQSKNSDFEIPSSTLLSSIARAPLAPS